MSTYLSIDLDFWGYLNISGMEEFVDKALLLHVPTCLVLSHELVLSHVDQFDIDRMINVDFHSDLCAQESGLQLNEGTWGCFVQERNRKGFEWRVPDIKTCFHEGEGRCDSPGYPDTDVHLYPKLSGWGSVQVREGLDHLPWDDVVGVGISISPYWCQSFSAVYDNALRLPEHLEVLHGLLALTELRGIQDLGASNLAEKMGQRALVVRNKHYRSGHVRSINPNLIGWALSGPYMYRAQSVALTV